MIAGYALNALLTFGYMFVSNPTQLFLLQIGLGIAEALSAPIWDALLPVIWKTQKIPFTGVWQVDTRILYLVSQLP